MVSQQRGTAVYIITREFVSSWTPAAAAPGATTNTAAAATTEFASFQLFE